MSDNINDLIKKADQIMESPVEDTNELRDELRSKLQQLRDEGYLPKGYAKLIKEKLQLKDENLVYHVISGRRGRFDYNIASELIELAAQPKPENDLIEKVDRLLNP